MLPFARSGRRWRSTLLVLVRGCAAAPQRRAAGRRDRRHRPRPRRAGRRAAEGQWPAGHSSDDLAPLVESLRSLGYPLLLKHDNYLSLSGKYVRGSTQKVYSPLQARALLAELREQRAQVIAQAEMRICVAMRSVISCTCEMTPTLRPCA